jgi:hypothetical protein
MSGGPPAPPWLLEPEAGFLTEAQEKQLDAIFSRLLPADRARGVPGATDAGASRFVSLLLARDPAVYVEIPGWQALYPASLGALDAWTQRKLGAALTDLDDDRMNVLIAGLEAGDLSDLPKTVDQKLLFRTLLRHCIQGCFSDPRWGGNRDKIMWRWIGYLQTPEDMR